MRASVMLAALGLLPLTLAGCNPQQKAQADSAARKAQQQTNQALDRVQKDLASDSLAVRVKSAMLTSGRLQTAGIHVDAKGHTVLRRGAVPSADQRALAERIARDTVPGGVTVENQLQVGHTGAAQ